MFLTSRLWTTDCGAAKSSTCVWYLDYGQPTRLWCCQVFYMCLIVNNRQGCGAAKSSTCAWYLDSEQPTRLWCCQVSYMCLISGQWTIDKTVVLPIPIHVFDNWIVYYRQDFRLPVLIHVFDNWIVYNQHDCSAAISLLVLTYRRYCAENVVCYTLATGNRRRVYSAFAFGRTDFN